MPVETDESLFMAANCWLSDFEEAISNSDYTHLELLFETDCHWRDLLAFTWHIMTVSGRDKVLSALQTYVQAANPSRFKVDIDRTPPRHVIRAGVKVIEAIFCFETAFGQASGVLRLLPVAEDGVNPKMWTLVTALTEIDGFEESIGKSRDATIIFAFSSRLSSSHGL